MLLPDAVVCISQQHLSAARHLELADADAANSSVPVVLVRLEGTESRLGDALDKLAPHHSGAAVGFTVFAKPDALAAGGLPTGEPIGNETTSRCCLASTR